MTVTTHQKKEDAGKNLKFSSRFEPLDLPLHGVRLPQFKIEDKHFDSTVGLALHVVCY